MTEISMLLLGGGKRVSLAQRFKTAAAYVGLELTVFAYEIDNQQPISTVANIILGKKWSDPCVRADIEGVLTENKIDLLLSNVDPATVLHASLKSDFESASFSSDSHVVAMCMSKNKTQDVCEAVGIPIIPRAKDNEFPQFAKPDAGSASIGAVQVLNKTDRDRILANTTEYIFQAYVDGLEYTVDAYVTRSGETLGISPRIRLLTVGGESIVTETVHDDELVAAASDVIRKLELRGPLTMQFIRRKADKALFLMEINPRFGGGVIASIEAGFDFPLMIIKELLGKSQHCVERGRRVLMKRYFQEVFYEAGD
jgi:carbamoyl-phosphate synthase large subunit